MDSSRYRVVFQSGTKALLLLLAATASLLDACSSDGGNPAPSVTIINTGGSSGASGSSAGDGFGGSSAGNAARAGSGSAVDTSPGGAAGEAGEGGGAGEAGAGPIRPSRVCPTSELGFYNQPSSSQKSLFDNVKRLGTHDSLPPLP